MSKNHLILFLISGTIFLNSCNNKNAGTKQTGPQAEIKSDTNRSDTATELRADSTTKDNFVSQSVNDELAKRIGNFITTQYLSEGDLRVIPGNERKFQLYQIDLNEDGKNEVFVNFMTSYFCGTGGCTILLLSDQLKPITKFTVTRTPLFAEHTKKNGWRILLTRSMGELKELVYSKGTYPSNPSVVQKANYDAPSGHAEIMFDDNYSKAKDYHF